MVLKHDKIALPGPLPPLTLFPRSLLSRRTPEKSGPFCRWVKKPYKEEAEICGHAVSSLEQGTEYSLIAKMCLGKGQMPLPLMLWPGNSSSLANN